MSDKEFKDTLKAMATFRDELTSSPERARAYLIEAGILPSDGNLAVQHPSQDA